MGLLLFKQQENKVWYLNSRESTSL
uniref:Uncharacterized protein n=1 Tax=Nelumbo nucifera TaxID=4432 RepID=A0A822ZSK4_NELNU|nr:TPA_asm: hypothetical protein HUJ06_017804 [Nelumbo nucifera]